MKAKIFYLRESQRKLSKHIGQLLENILYSNIDIEYIAIDDNYNKKSAKDTHSKVESYLGFLKKAMIKMHDFIFFLEYESGGGYYMGEEYITDATGLKEMLTLKEDYFPSIFPGVVIGESLKIIPFNFHDKFSSQTTKFHWLFRPFDNNGVLFVDYNFAEQIEDSINIVDRKLKLDIIKFCNRQTVIREIPKPDFFELSKLLDIDIEYFVENREVFEKNYFSLNVDFQHELEIDNSEEIKLEYIVKPEFSYKFVSNIFISVKSPENTLIDFHPKTINLKDKEISITVLLKSIVLGYLPLEVHLKGVVDNEEFLSIVSDVVNIK